MDGSQYEELCRWFIAEQVGLRVEEVKCVSIPNAKRPGLPEYRHQIDLYWETGDAVALYLNIANAKWRGTARVEQGEVMLLQQVRQQVAAHKAFMITNLGFTAGAVAVAKDHGIALHVVVPTFDASRLPQGNRAAIQQALRDISSQTASRPYTFHVEHRGLGYEREGTTPSPVPTPPVARTPPGLERRLAQGSSRPLGEGLRNRSISGTETRGGFGAPPGSRGGGARVKR